MYSIFYFLIFVNLVNCFSYEVTYTGDNFWIKRSVRPLADEYFSFYLNNIYSTKTHYRADFCGVFAVFFTCVLMLLFIKLYILTRSEIFYLLRTIVGILLHIIIWSLVFIGFGGWMFYRFSFSYFKIFFVESKVKIQVISRLYHTVHWDLLPTTSISLALFVLMDRMKLYDYII